jgi:hypothetical protein
MRRVWTSDALLFPSSRSPAAPWLRSVAVEPLHWQFGINRRSVSRSLLLSLWKPRASFRRRRFPCRCIPSLFLNGCFAPSLGLGKPCAARTRQPSALHKLLCRRLPGLCMRLPVLRSPWARGRGTVAFGLPIADAYSLALTRLPSLRGLCCQPNTNRLLTHPSLQPRQPARLYQLMTQLAQTAT